MYIGPLRTSFCQKRKRGTANPWQEGYDQLGGSQVSQAWFTEKHCSCCTSKSSLSVQSDKPFQSKLWMINQQWPNSFATWSLSALHLKSYLNQLSIWYFELGFSTPLKGPIPGPEFWLALDAIWFLNSKYVLFLFSDVHQLKIWHKFKETPLAISWLIRR